MGPGGASNFNMMNRNSNVNNQRNQNIIQPAQNNINNSEEEIPMMGPGAASSNRFGNPYQSNNSFSKPQG